MVTKVSVTELATALTDTRERVRRGERVAVERDGLVVAVIVPPDPAPTITWRVLAEALRDVPPLDDEFADDLAAIRAAQQPARVPEWPN